MALPKQVKYSDLKPIGVPTDVRYMKFTPQTAFGVINNSDQIRFQINSPGFWDPYSTYLTIEVDFGLSDENVFYQIDGSAHSLINELVVGCGGNELERIQEYDTLGNFLSDMSYSPEMRLNRQHEGVGYREFHNSNMFNSGIHNGNQNGRYRFQQGKYNPTTTDVHTYFQSEQQDYGVDPFYSGKKSTMGDTKEYYS